MTVSKRTRFEVLRRDNFKCYYCGNVAAEKPLTIDHVVPIALGGSDEVTNLVAACPDCNAGKSSVMPESEMVARVNVDVEIAKAAQNILMREVSKAMADQSTYEASVWELWDYHAPSYARARLRESMKVVTYIYDWHSKGVPLTVVEKGIRIALGSDVAWSGKWAYAAGVVRNTIGDAVAAGLTEEEKQALYDDGFHDGGNGRETLLENQDYVHLLVDGMTDHWAWRKMSVA